MSTDPDVVRRLEEIEVAIRAINDRLGTLEGGLREAWATNVEALNALEGGLREAWATNVEALNALEHRIARTAQVAGHERRALDGIELRNVLWSLVAREPEQRKRLAAVRASPEYELAYTERDPLVSVVIATRERAELLAGRSVPSVLAQTHPAVEVVVVGDAAGPETAEALEALGDERIRYTNLTQRVVASDEPSKHWLVAASTARNEGMRQARGRWTVSLDDDDALRPDAVERLLACAVERRAEVAYGRLVEHDGTGGTTRRGAFPPRRGEFSWVAAIAHAGLRLFERELVAAELGEPGDAFMLERMLRASVRFAMIDADVADYFPSTVRGA